MHLFRVWTLTALIGLLPAVAGAGVAFPESGGYSQDFAGPLGAEWTFDRWTTIAVPVNGATQAGSIQGTGPAGVTTPLPAILPPTSFLSYGFGGTWVTTLARGDELNGPGPRPTARLEFTDLPWHDRLDLDFLLAVGDTIDGSTQDGPLTIKIDGTVVFQFQFSGGGYSLPQTNGIVRLTAPNGENLTPNWYWEQWKTDAQTSDDRFALSWTLDSVYDMSGFTGFSIPHTGDTLTIEFLHELSSNYTDEYFAFDNVTVTLNVVPEPSASSLALAGVVLVWWRRRRG